MRGRVCILNHPFFAVTDATGKFEIKLPPGEYELSFWHESNHNKLIVPAVQKVTVLADKSVEIPCVIFRKKFNWIWDNRSR
jgi:hypothetical protein